MDWPGRELAPVVAEGALAPLECSPVIRIIALEGGFKPLVHVLGQGHLAVTRDELVKRHLFGRNRIETVVGPLGVAQIHEHFPAVLLVTGPVVEGDQTINCIAGSAGITRLHFPGGKLMQLRPVSADKFGDQFLHNNRLDRLFQFGTEVT